jgi:uncharacterized protein YqfB (UPF0267 family)
MLRKIIKGTKMLVSVYNKAIKEEERNREDMSYKENKHTMAEIYPRISENT